MMLAELRRYVVEEAEEDWFSFDDMLSMIREVTGSSDDLLQQAGEAAVQFVREQTIVPGTLTETEGFTPWPTSPTESADRIEHEVAAMIRDGISPMPGQICWFDLPATAQPPQD
ncbi:hypothetical protein [Actinoalloteichus hymeniacidonis]|uniref:Uncharacterized protein n=1 Tax=Actinoalloteichus hymeniacidonis TaxID=340345 RepID=A0AAC9HT36_9PSEU|nr:hypothetical protein [Actinoalloteichus hymeniacidonis]AOS64928.1 hypothetical protein TL08_20685 [Actinoalloteichus hymeniacidonis]MBB5906997.1 hypothetical protein [Actinoalloteichus hymeniacidonis]